MVHNWQAASGSDTMEFLVGVLASSFNTTTRVSRAIFRVTDSSPVRWSWKLSYCHCSPNVMAHHRNSVVV